MAPRWGPGPVFAWEARGVARRWGTYAMRAACAAALLVALGVVYEEAGRQARYGNRSAFQAQSQIGPLLYVGLVSTQLTLVLMAAPAAAAGAICLDRARGTLAHLLMTDLSAREIVLGKLGARLLPVFTLIACALPVEIAASWLGGIDPEAILQSLLVTVGVGVFGCALALLFSLWASKTHEALMGTYAVVVLWLLADQFSLYLGLFGFFWSPPATSNPFWLVLAPYTRPGATTLGDAVVFCAATVGLAVPLAALAVWRLRSAGTREPARRARRGRRPWDPFGALLRRLPGPSLDGNPVLWREWHRNRPSRGARLIGGVYVLIAGGFSLVLIAELFQGHNVSQLSVWVNGLQVAFGFLMLSVSAATSLAEERVRGSLDVLLATPLPTRTIVVGKWLGTFRQVPLLIALPMLIAVLGACHTGRWFAATWLLLYLLAFGALISSLGLALSIEIRSLGRAVGLTVLAYLLVTVGWFFFCLTLIRRLEGELAAMGSPFMAAAGLSYESLGTQTHIYEQVSFTFWVVFWTLFHASAALVLFLVAWARFDRRLERVPERAAWHAAFAAWERRQRTSPLSARPARQGIS